MSNKDDISNTWDYKFIVNTLEQNWVFYIVLKCKTNSYPL